MDSLFQPDFNAAFVKRIQRLRPDANAQWGKMNAAQMLAHCQAAMRVATGELRLKRSVLGLLFGRLALRGLKKPKPTRRNLPTAPEFLVRDARDFGAEQAKMIELLQRFGRGGPAGVTKEAHPFFGPMTTEEWDLLQWKHLDHHLRQFGV